MIAVNHSSGFKLARMSGCGSNAEHRGPGSVGEVIPLKAVTGLLPVGEYLGGWDTDLISRRSISDRSLSELIDLALDDLSFRP